MNPCFHIDIGVTYQGNREPNNLMTTKDTNTSDASQEKSICRACANSEDKTQSAHLRRLS